MITLPLLVEPTELQSHLHRPELLIVDLCLPEQYSRGHIPNAVHLDYTQIVASRPPVMGLLPSADSISRTLAAIGLSRDRHIVAYDDEGGGKASRLLWTLHALGHEKISLLNGGLHSWAKEEHPLTNEVTLPQSSDYQANYTGEFIADRHHILERLGAEDFVTLDARSLAEYEGEDIRAKRGGHIPGAKHLDWLEILDRNHNLRLLPPSMLREKLEGLDITADKEVVVYCHSHHRSALSYLMLKLLGYERVKGYPGSWSDWGNQPDTPVE